MRARSLPMESLRMDQRLGRLRRVGGLEVGHGVREGDGGRDWMRWVS